MKRLITESGCNGENKIISCEAVQALKTAIDALTMLMGILSVLAAVLTLLRALTRSFTWLVRIVTWLERLFDRIGVVEKYLEAITLAIVALREFFDYLTELCEESWVVCTFVRKLGAKELYELKSVAKDISKYRNICNKLLQHNF